MDTIDKYKSVAEFNASNFNKRHVFILNHTNPDPSVRQFINNKPSGLGNYFPPHVSLPMEDQVYDAQMKRLRVIRYIPGELSIYKDEQTQDEPSKPRIPERLEFLKGECVVDSRESQKMEWLEKSNWNGSNKQRDPNKQVKFFHINLGISLKKEMDKDKLKQKAIMWCHEAKHEDVMSLARVMQMDLEQEEPAIRWGLKILAERDYTRFLQAIDNPASKRKHNILQGIERGILIVDKENNAMQWSTGMLIQPAPLGKDPIDFLVDSTFASPEGERVYAVILSYLESGKKIEMPSEPTPAKQEVSNKIPSEEPQAETPESDLLKAAIEAKVIKKKGNWLIFNEKVKTIGTKAMIEKLKTKEVYDAVMVAMEKAEEKAAQ